MHQMKISIFKVVGVCSYFHAFIHLRFKHTGLGTHFNYLGYLFGTVN